ncbi:MAG TPA: protein kinase [Thermoanaerobaculia bacterium]|nr:protein kinase [Thermoanaerobaculia bacterium]
MWDEIAETFDRALELPPARREAWLAEHRSERVRREVAAMLRENEPLELENELLPPETLQEGTRIGSYRVRSWLGEGGMGEVYLAARDVDFEQIVAIKILRVPYGGRDAAARFRRERRILAHLNHPAVVPLLDSGITPDGRPYLVLQYVDGVPITRYCEEKKLSVDARLRLFVDVCRAVQYAHGRLIVHRDLKPSNILVTPEGEPRLLDFGIAKMIASDSEETELTHRDGAPMTPERAAPEQLRGELSSTATDVWALGVLLYELLTGRLPFAITGRSRAEIERAVTAEPERLRLRQRADLDTVVAVALRREPDQRYASAGQLADDVERVLAGQPILARPHGVGYRIRRFVGRNRATVAASVLALVSLLAFTFTTLLQAQQVKDERDRANAVVELLVEVLGGAAPTEGAPGATLDVEQLLARGEHRARELHAQPEIQAKLWHVLGKIQLERSSLAKAREILTLAHDRQARIAGVDDERTIEIALDLAKAEAKLGERKAAETRLRTLVARQTNAELEAKALHQLGEVVHGDEGRRLIERALALRREAGKPVPVAESLSELGAIAFEQGSMREAERLWRESLALAAPALGVDHPHVLAIQANLALVVSDPEEQSKIFRGLVVSHEKRFGRNSVQAAIAWNNLGCARARHGDLDDALPALRASVDRWTAIAGRDHPQTLNTRRSIARILDLRGQNEESLRELNAISAVLRGRGTEPRFHANVRAQAAGVLMRLGRADEAERMAREAAAAAPGDSGVQFVFAAVLLARGRATEAEAVIRPIAAKLAREFAAGDARVAAAQLVLARAWIAQGRVAEGRALLAKHLDAFAADGTAHPDDIAAARRLMSAPVP